MKFSKTSGLGIIDILCNVRPHMITNITQKIRLFELTQYILSMNVQVFAILWIGCDSLKINAIIFTTLTTSNRTL